MDIVSATVFSILFGQLQLEDDSAANASLPSELYQVLYRTHLSHKRISLTCSWMRIYLK